jgi:Spy/CpxP family protein refolding chaperone
MKLLNLSAQALLAGAILAKPLAGHAQAMMPPPEHAMQHGGAGGHGGGPDARHSLPFLRGVALTEAQQDRVFAIMHAQEPQWREQTKNVRKAHEALNAMATSGQFDDSKAAVLAQAAGQAVAAMALLHARTEAQVMAILTPEQRQQAASERPRHPAHS